MVCRGVLFWYAGSNCYFTWRPLTRRIMSVECDWEDETAREKSGVLLSLQWPRTQHSLGEFFVVLRSVLWAWCLRKTMDVGWSDADTWMYIGRFREKCVSPIKRKHGCSVERWNRECLCPIYREYSDGEVEKTLFNCCGAGILGKVDSGYLYNVHRVVGGSICDAFQVWPSTLMSHSRRTFCVLQYLINNGRIDYTCDLTDSSWWSEVEIMLSALYIYIFIYFFVLNT